MPTKWHSNKLRQRLNKLTHINISKTQLTSNASSVLCLILIWVCIHFWSHFQWIAFIVLTLMRWYISIRWCCYAIPIRSQCHTIIHHEFRMRRQASRTTKTDTQSKLKIRARYIHIKLYNGIMEWRYQMKVQMIK